MCEISLCMLLFSIIVTIVRVYVERRVSTPRGIGMLFRLSVCNYARSRGSESVICVYYGRTYKM